LKTISKLLKNRLLLITTIIPTTLAIIYFGLIASDVYISESRFVVRSPEKQSASPLGLLLKGAGFSRAQDDTYTVQDYLISRDALQALMVKQDVRAAFARDDIDPFSRFGGITYWWNSFEALHQYYQQKVTLQFDPVSAITTMTVKAFRPEIAYEINQELLDQGELQVNRLNERGRQDLIRFAAGEMVIAEQKAKAAALALSNYRNEKNVIDPEKQSAIQLQQVAKLQDELIATKSQLAQLQMLARENPQIPSLQRRAQTLQTEIDAEVARVAGGDKSLANKAADFQRLLLEREFADRQLGSALASLEQARNEAQRKQLYLERIVQPNKPDYPLEPRRIRGILTTLILGLIAWGILNLLVAGVKEHHG
jgi:capsular polysaccharide transport system permease protein